MTVSCITNVAAGYAEFHLNATQATCAPCTPVEHAAADAVYTCTSRNDSRITGCADGYARVIGGAGSADACKADTWTGCVELIAAVQDPAAVCTSPTDFQDPTCAGCDCDNATCVEAHVNTQMTTAALEDAALLHRFVVIAKPARPT